jgi:hypothetical protein
VISSSWSSLFWRYSSERTVPLHNKSPSLTLLLVILARLTPFTEIPVFSSTVHLNPTINPYSDCSCLMSKNHPGLLTIGSFDILSCRYNSLTRSIYSFPTLTTTFIPAYTILLDTITGRSLNVVIYLSYSCFSFFACSCYCSSSLYCWL